MAATTGSRIKLLRTLVGKTQWDFSEFLGISQTQLSFIEADKREADEKTIQQIESAFGISLKDPKLDEVIELQDRVKKTYPVTSPQSLESLAA